METFLIEHFDKFLVLGLLLALFFKESLTEFINTKLGINVGEERVPDWASKLQLYFNHDTTSHHDRTHEKLDKLQELTTETNRTLKEIKEYGLICREK